MIGIRFSWAIFTQSRPTNAVSIHFTNGDVCCVCKRDLTAKAQGLSRRYILCKWTPSYCIYRRFYCFKLHLAVRDPRIR